MDMQKLVSIGDTLELPDIRLEVIGLFKGASRWNTWQGSIVPGVIFNFDVILDEEGHFVKIHKNVLNYIDDYYYGYLTYWIELYYHYLSFCN